MADALRQTLRRTALRCLAQREHSRSELRSRLLRSATARGRRADTAHDAPAFDTAEGFAACGGPEAMALAAEPEEGTGSKPSIDLAAAVDALLDQLGEQGLLSDQRFMDTRVHARRAQWGQRRIAHELQQHGLVLDPRTSESLQRTEFTRALALWRRRFGEPLDERTNDPKDRLRQMRFLAARGFSGDVIRRVVQCPDDLGDEAGLDIDPA